nr:hypothetical protein [Tanacetum cinerariifolium]
MNIRKEISKYKNVSASQNPFKGNIHCYSEARRKFYEKLPYSIKTLQKLPQTMLKRLSTLHQSNISFKHARVLLQDSTGVPAVVDLACKRDAMNKLGGDS